MRFTEGLVPALMIAISAVTGTTVTVEAQDGPAASNDVRVTHRMFDNFTQASDLEPKLNITATGVENVTTVPLTRRRDWRGYLRGELLVYERFGGGPLAGLGVRRDAGRHLLDASIQGEWKRPVVDIDETFGEANTLVTGAQYGFRPTRGLLLGASTTYRKDAFEQESLNGDTYDFGSSVRYQMLGRRFVPSAGIAFGRRGSVNPAQNFSQRDGFVRLQSEFSGVRLSARYRHRAREYTVPDEQSRNFGREDVRRQVSVSAEVPIYKELAAVTNYGIERSRSTRADRGFRTQSFSIGMAWRIRFMQQPPEPPEIR